MGSSSPRSAWTCGVSTWIMAIFVAPSRVSGGTIMNVVPTLPPPIGYELAALSSSDPGDTPTRGRPAGTVASITPVGLAAVVSLTVATSPSSTNCRAHSTSPLGSRLVSQVVSSMQWPPTPPRALKASTEASAAVTWSTSDSTGDSKTVMIPIGYGSSAVSQAPSSTSRPDGSTATWSSDEPEPPPSSPGSSVQAPTTSASTQAAAATLVRLSPIANPPESDTSRCLRAAFERQQGPRTALQL